MRKIFTSILSVALLSMGVISPANAVTEQHYTSVSEATDDLNSLEVKGRSPKTGYTRSQFGSAWADVNQNKCDTRNDILGRDLYEPSYIFPTIPCKVMSGTLYDQYTEKEIPFLYGVSTSGKVQIDHIVALSDAWQSGAQTLSFVERKKLANDPDNLIAVDGPTNGAKGDSDAASWLPPNKNYRCIYVSNQIFVKKKYGLWVKPSEKEAMQNVLNECSDESLKYEYKKVDTTPYQNCSEVLADGKRAITSSDPRFNPRMDRDKDGVACE